MDQPPGVRLHVVTGKGGTGKTTVAAALAMALARDGGRVLLVEVEGRQGISQVFGVDPLDYEERLVAQAPGRGEVYGLAVDAEKALLEYLELFYRLGRAGKALHRIGAIEFATTIAPGLRDVLLTGKVKEAVSRTAAKDRGRVYHAVVLDAVPTGRISRFLNVNTEVAGLARVGPIHEQALGVMELLRSPLTAIHLVTLLEEMPVQETVDGIAELHRVGLPVGEVVVNMARERRLPDDAIKAAAEGRLDRAALADGLRAADVPVTGELLDGLQGEAADHAQRLLLEDRLREELAGQDRAPVELPFLPDGVDLVGLADLAAILARSGLRRGTPR